MVYPYVGCGRVEAQRAQQFERIGRHLFDRQDRIAPDDQIPVDPFQPGGDGFLAEPVHGRFRGLERAETLDEFLHVVDREIGLAVDQPVVRSREVVAHQLVADRFERLGRHLARVEQLLRFAVRGRMNLDPVVIGPHQPEADVVHVRGLQEPFVEATVQKRHAVVAIPVEQHHVDAVRRGGLDLTGHHGRVLLVGIAPQWDLGLVVPLEARLRLAHEFPLAPALALVELVERVSGVVVRKIITGDRDVVSGYRLLRAAAGQDGRGGGQRQQSSIHNSSVWLVFDGSFSGRSRSVRLLRAEYVAHGLQIAHAVFRVGLQVASFAPFVPRVDDDDAFRFGFGEGPRLRFGQIFLEQIGRIVDDHGAERVVAPTEPLAGRYVAASGRRVPSHADVEMVRHRNAGRSVFEPVRSAAFS